MIARDFASLVRGVDRGFVARQRARGTPNAAIAQMGGWCVADVLAVPHDPYVVAMERAKLIAEPPKPLRAADFPAVVEILAHIAEQYDITPEDILGSSHIADHVEPRHEAFAVVYELNLFTGAQLGSIFNKTPPAIVYGLKRHYERLRFRGPGRDW